MTEYKRVALFVGRFSPFHSGHKYIVDVALNQGKKVCIGIRDTPLSDADPYTYEQRVEMIKGIYGNKVDIIKLPDIESINIGRGVGYEVNYIDAPKDIQGISATEIRRRMKNNDPSWKQFVPKEVAEYLEEMK